MEQLNSEVVAETLARMADAAGTPPLGALDLGCPVSPAKKTEPDITPVVPSLRED